MLLSTVALVQDLNDQGQTSLPGKMAVVGSTLYFTASDPIHGAELWKSDGTVAGTTFVKDINPGTGWSSIDYVTAAGGLLFFTANDGAHGAEVWRSDGTDAGTFLLKDIVAGTGNANTQSLVAVGSTVFFYANDGVRGAELWKSDGTVAGTDIVKDISPGATGSSPTYFAAFNNALYFKATDGVSGSELWKSDGTDAGTVMVKDLVAGSASGNPGGLTVVGNTLFFYATDAAHGYELWSSDGSAAGTAFLKDARPGTTSSNPGNLTNVGGTLYFSATNSGGGATLWKSDGTAAGTVAVQVISAAFQSSGTPDYFSADGNRLYFIAGDGSHGTEPWTSDGTAAGTFMLKDINPSTTTNSVQYGSFANVGGQALFYASNGTTGDELWRSDGTAAGTVVVKAIVDGGPTSSPPFSWASFQGKFYLSGTTYAGGAELWTTDGTSAGTVLFTDLNPGTSSSNPAFAALLNGQAVFSATSPALGRELFKSDGTNAGTGLLLDIFPGAIGAIFSTTARLGNNMLFTAKSQTSGIELWKTDGTAAGTSLLVDIRPGIGSSFPNSLYAVKGAAYFFAYGATGITELWKSDGTAAGTARIADADPGVLVPASFTFANVNNTVYYTASDAASGTELWKSDGTTAGTVRVADINPGAGSSSPANLANINGTVYFSASDGVNGAELWKTDGTAAGTAMVRNINPGAADSSPSSFFIYGGATYFSAATASLGAELWTTDGTSAGTFLVQDINPGAGSSSPKLLLDMGANALLTATTDAYGNELWNLTGSTNTAPVLSGANALASFNEDATPTPTLVSALIAGQVADANGPASGIAIIAATSTSGTWQYSLDGANWLALGAVSPGSARLLRADATTQVRFTPNLNFNGTINGALTFRAWDTSDGFANGAVGDSGLSGGSTAYSSASASSSITVNSVNDAPSFTKGSDFVMNEDAPATTVVGWATAISPGALNEFGQALTFTAVAGIPSLFSVQPSIDPVTGNLTFTPAPDEFGSTVVWVTLTNNGGTANGGVNTSAVQSFTVTVNPVNDAPSFTKGPDITVNEDEPGTGAFGWATSILVGPYNEAGQAPIFTVVAATPSLFSVQPNVDPITGILAFTPAANAFGSTTVTVKLFDNGGTANGGVNTSATQTFTITVNPVNDAPSFTKGADVTVNEDSGVKTVAAWATAISAGAANESGQTLAFTSTAATPSLFSVQPSVDPVTGNLTFTPAANAFGSTTVTVKLADNGGVANGGVNTSATQTFTINILAVNDVPSFTKGANVVVNEDSGARTVAAWATSISVGPTNEGGQTRTFTATNNATALFSVQPGIDSSGNLTFTPAADAFGVATVTVTLKDNGSTANGGVDTSPAQTFTITVNSINDQPTFTAGPNITVNENAGFVRIANWAKSMSPGAANESGDVLSFQILSWTNVSLLSILPSVDPTTGDLTFNTATDVNGTSTYTLRLNDSGGSANGGNPFSATKSFTITVLPVNNAPVAANDTYTQGLRILIRTNDRTNG
ncbi:MAG: Ig-like domain-containing protein [Planctomycetota bacterium]|nr:Ig-like domain-containing protein [Planctomycetota bacterium]